MKNSLSKVARGGFVSVVSFAVALMVACSGSDDKSVAGGTSDDAGIIADLNVAGLAQKGPFVKGSVVTVQGIDCKTLKFTDEVFNGEVKSDKGDFSVDEVELSSTCAVFEVKGKYRNEISGAVTDGEMTLHALTNLKERNSVNINVLTELEYKRVMNLVTEEEMLFDDAKKQAAKEVLAAFNVKGDVAKSEDLNILETGDDNAALLAISVMVQGGLDESALAKRLGKFEDSFAESGEWSDDETKAAIAEWVESAVASGKFDTIRKNIESWGYADSVSAFETFVGAFADGDSVTLSSSSSGTKAGMTSSSMDSIGSSSLQNDKSSSSIKDPRTSYLNPNINYGEMTDSRDGQVYKTVTIGNQIWMAENLNYKTENSYCYNDSTENCAKYGRLYVWSEAMDVCPEGWHLPDTTEWYTLLYGTIGDIAVVGIEEVGRNIRSKNGWLNQGTGGIDVTDALGFSVLPGGSGDFGSYVGKGYNANFWTALSYSNRESYSVYISYNNAVAFSIDDKGIFESVRCLKGKPVGASSSSSSAVSSSSVAIPISVLCKTEVVDACEYGTLTDDRDGQTYKTVKIGKQWWMAENLNYNFSVDSLGIGSYCYNDSAKYCEKYGALYTWAVAMDSAGLWSDDAKGCGYEAECSPKQPVQGICPAGWHMPDTTDWGVLRDILGENAGIMLKSQTAWYNDPQPGTDAVGFTALPGGLWYGILSEYEHESEAAYFWSTSSYKNIGVYYKSVGIDMHYLKTGLDYMNGRLSVRCLKN